MSKSTGFFMDSPLLSIATHIVKLPFSDFHNGTKHSLGIVATEKK